MLMSRWIHQFSYNHWSQASWAQPVLRWMIPSGEWWVLLSRREANMVAMADGKKTQILPNKQTKKGLGDLTRTIRDQSKELPPNSIGKTQALAQRVADRKNHALASLCKRLQVWAPARPDTQPLRVHGHPRPPHSASSHSANANTADLLSVSAL